MPPRPFRNSRYCASFPRAYVWGRAQCSLAAEAGATQDRRARALGPGWAPLELDPAHAGPRGEPASSTNTLLRCGGACLRALTRALARDDDTYDQRHHRSGPRHTRVVAGDALDQWPTLDSRKSSHNPVWVDLVSIPVEFLAYRARPPISISSLGRSSHGG